MFPIYEQGSGKGIGYGLGDFIKRFELLCEEHQKDGRAKAFAFIFYDAENVELQMVLKSEGVFVQLDRLAGKNLSVFYLRSARDQVIQGFNRVFFSKLGLSGSVTVPCVAFFKLGKNGFTDVAVAQLNSADLIHGFHELYSAIERYLEGGAENAVNTSMTLTWVKSASKFISIEMLRSALRELTDFLATLRIL